MKWRRFLCRVFGHDPEGPVSDEPECVLYACRRCGCKLEWEQEEGEEFHSVGQWLEVTDEN